jgi:SulP family sulfate permease
VIYFANAGYTTENIIKRLDEVKTPVKFLLLDLQAMGFIDITGIDELKVLMDDVKSRNFNVAYMGVHRPVLQVFKQSGLLEEIEDDLLIEHRGDAITVLFKKIDHDYCKNQCPYALFYECKSVKLGEAKAEENP